MAEKFTLIEGGGRGPPGRHGESARYHLQEAIIEILRSLVRGYDGRGTIAHHFSEFTRHLNEADASLGRVIQDAITELHKELDHRGEVHISQEEREAIVLSALQVAAESLADDPARREDYRSVKPDWSKQ